MPNIAPLYGRGFPLKEKNQREARWQLLTKLAFGLDAMSSTAYFFSAGRRKRYDVSFFFLFYFLCGEFKRQQGESNFGKERKKIYKGGCSVPRPRVHRKGGPCALLTCTERALVFCFVFNLTNSGVATFCCHRRCFD